MMARVQRVERGGHDAGDHKRQGDGGGTDASAGHLDAEHQRRECGAGEDEPTDVERRARGFAHFFNVDGDKRDADNADGHVDVEDPVPRQIGDDETTDRRPEDGADGGKESSARPSH